MEEVDGRGGPWVVGCVARWDGRPHGLVSIVCASTDPDRSVDRRCVCFGLITLSPPHHTQCTQPERLEGIKQALLANAQKQGMVRSLE